MYFDKFTNIQQTHERYRLLAKYLHPDVGGNHALMQEVNLAYADKKARLKGREPKVKSTSWEDNWEPTKETVNPNNFHHSYNEADSAASEQMKKIKLILDWAKEHEEFDPKFVKSLLDRLLKGMYLTIPQETSLNKIIRRFKIKRSYA